MNPKIPKSTLAKLNNPAPEGHRHGQIMDIAVSLKSHGWDDEMIFDIIRPRFPNTGPHPVPDKEIWDILDGTAGYDLQPYATGGALQAPLADVKVPDSRVVDVLPPDEAVRRFVGDFRCSEADLVAKSPEQISDIPWFQTAWFIHRMYEPHDLINIVSDFIVGEDGKAKPTGFGDTLRRCEWYVFRFKKTQRAPQSEAGAWIRMNPLDGDGIKDRNVKAYRYTLLEFDELPLDLQLAFFARLKLPIAALVKSGRRSVHCWIRVEAGNAAEYAKSVAELFDMLTPFGIDRANKNPSRLARLPGAVRRLDGEGDSLQHLLYLNPSPRMEAIYA